MNKFYFFLFLLFWGNPLKSLAQGFNFSLEGNPVDITNWELGNLSSIENDEIILTQPIGNQNGYIYYGTPQNLASCSEFTVEFEFKITQSSNPTADGLSFFYITNPPSGFISGGGIGLPTNPEGIILVLDTYDNDNNNNNPLISLRNMPGNVDYIEGNTTHNIHPDITHQSFIADGNWHKCVIHFQFGEITVSFDDQAPVIVSNTTMNLQGYFGFSSSTGGSWAKHAIKNVHIYGASEPAQPNDMELVFCQGQETNEIIDIEGSNLKWYSHPIGGNQLTEPPIINTNQPGTFTYYVAETVPHCNLESERAEIKIIIYPKAVTPDIHIPIYCSGQPTNILPSVLNSFNYVWYSDLEKTQQVIPQINTSSPGDKTLYVENISGQGCPSDLLEVIIPVHQSPLLSFDYDLIQQCDFSDSIFIQNSSHFTDFYRWTLNDTLQSDDQHPNLHLSFEALHKITLIGNNEFCIDSLSEYIESGHDFTVDFNDLPTYFCENEIVFLENLTHSTATGNELAEAKWRVNGLVKGNSWDFNDQFQGLGSFEVTLEVKNENGCVDSITKTIYVDPILHDLYSIKDTIICQGQSIQLVPTNSSNGLTSSTISWGNETIWENNVHQELTHSYQEPGQYIIDIAHSFRACPDVFERYHIEVIEVPKVQLPTLDELCLQGEKIQVTHQLPLQEGHQYLWSNGDQTPTTDILTPGRYWLEISNGYCIGSEYIDIEEDCFLRLPNAFTPNGDGNNDYFLPRQLISKGLVSFEMEIYNRWGQVIFQTNNIDGRGWDGKFNHVDQPSDVYVYKIYASFKNGRTEEYTGNITLIR